jgi:Cu/Zn superoxide dismutase
MNLYRSSLALVAAAACTFAVASVAARADDMSAAMPAHVTVKMNAQNGSNENGTATLTQQADGVQVVIALENATGSQPSHIHAGTVKGVTVADLVAGGFAVNVHKSASDLATYVSCGNIGGK